MRKINDVNGNGLLLAGLLFGEIGRKQEDCPNTKPFDNQRKLNISDSTRSNFEGREENGNES